MIPAFDDFGHLPVGGHECTWAEFYERFRSNDWRNLLCVKLEGIVPIAQGCGFLKVLIGGSFPTAVDRPGDMDLAWVTDFDVTKETVDPECVKLMDDNMADEEFGWSMLYLPIDHDLQRIEHWATQLGFCSKTRRNRGMLVIDL
jgi:hypothetical protein